MTSNGSTLRDENGDTPDWIELFNGDAQTVDLTGWGLSDSPADPFRWRFANAAILPHSFLLAYASGKDRQPVAAPALDPAAVPSLKLWLRADRIQTNDAAQVRWLGGEFFVARWNDQSGAGHHASQGSSGSQPRWIDPSPAAPGQPVVRFDGLDDLLLLSQVIARNNFTLVVVARSTVSHEVDAQDAVGVGGTSGQRYLFGAQHGGDFQAGAGLSLGTNGASVYEHGSSYMPALAVSATPLFGFAVITVRYTDRRPDLFINGSLSAVGLMSARTNVNAPVEIGSGAYGAFSGDVAEILVYDRSLSDAERAGIEGDLATRHGLVLSRFYHTNFKLDAAGGSILLTRPDRSTADRWTPDPIPRDVSFGRQPDGIGSNFYFMQPTPGASNRMVAATELLQKPVFSVTRGFYTNSIELTLSVTNEGTTVRYTLDGSEPTVTSPAYSAPLSLRSRAGQPNDLSTIPTAGGWQPPLGEVFKATVVRARAFKAGAISSGSKTHTYVIAPTAHRYSLPVVSLVTDRKNFFDPSLGLYVVGNAPGGNFFQRGPAWERPVHIELFEADGSVAFAQNAGIAIHGNTSRGLPIKALDVIADWSKEGPFDYKFFPDRPQTSWQNIMLRQSGQDYFYSYFRDSLMHNLAEDFGADTMASRACVVLLNGEYWGIHHLREKEDKNFIAAHGKVDPKQIDFLEGYAAPIEGDTVHYNALLNFLATRDLQDSTNFAYVGTQMEVGNYIDYKVAEIWTYRWDIGNHRLWRPRSADGRWRWLQFDNDVGWGGFWAVPPAWQFRMLDYDTEPAGPWTQYESNPGGNDHNSPVTTFLLRALLRSTAFRNQFINRFADLMNSVYQPANTLPRIDRFASEIAREMGEHIRRWRQPASLSAWTNDVEVLRTFATLRAGFCRQQLTNKFGLRGTITVSGSVNPPAGGSMQVSTVEITAPTNLPWSGIYFRDVPIPFSAHPNSGYRFVGWQGLFGSSATNRTNTLLLNANLTLVAKFQEDTNSAEFDPPAADSLPYLFTHWESTSAAGSFPPSMVFVQSATNAAPDPGLADELTNRWMLPYDRTMRSRFIGLGADGLAWQNTSDPQADGGGYVGAILLGLRTSGRTNVQVVWRGGTVIPGSRAYAIRLQFRVGAEGPFLDVTDKHGLPMEYVRSPNPGDYATLGPVALPAGALDRPYIQLRWKYYWISGVSGTRDQLRIDDIAIVDRSVPPSGSAIPFGDHGVALEFTATPLFPYVMEVSTNLVDWTVLDAYSASADGRIRREESLELPSRFYRLRGQ